MSKCTGLALILSLVVSSGYTLSTVIANRREGDRERERDMIQSLPLCRAHYTVDFVTVPCWITSTPSYPCPDATSEISGLYRTGLSGIPYIHPESVDSRT